MKAVFVQGIGAVSPAGWTVDSFRDALAKGEPLPVKTQSGSRRSSQVRTVPPPASRPECLMHSRLRRASPISQFALAAALEALGSDASQFIQGANRLGIVFCVMAACVNYSRRFYAEVLRDPGTASPLIFPETVFNAPASHLSAFLGSTALNYTLVGDPGTFLAGLALGAHWLLDGTLDACLVVSAEESDWIVSDAYHRFDRRGILSEGAGALYLRCSAHKPLAQLAAVTSSQSFLDNQTRLEAAQAMRAELPQGSPDHLLCDGTQGLARTDAPERAAWAGWPGSRLSVKRVLGEGLAAASAWQCVAAVDALGQGRFATASISVVGCNQQAIGAQFVRPIAPPA